MTAVEPDDEVRSIACEYFGAPGDWGELVGGCGAEAVAKASDRSFDLVVVDAADGAGAPPADATFVVPQVQVLLNVTGTQWDPVKDVTVQDVSPYNVRAAS